MRILIATDMYYPFVNGLVYFTRRLASRLKQCGHEVLVIAPSKGLRSEYSQLDGVDVLGLPTIPVLSYKNDLRSVLPIAIQKPIKKVIGMFHPDIVHAQGHFIIVRTVLSIARKRSIPIVGTNHFMPENLINHFHLPHAVNQRIMKWMWRDCLKVFENMDAVTTPTTTAAEVLQSQGYGREVQVISCGIDTNNFHPSKKNHRILEKYNLPNTPLLLYVGRLDPEKNLDLVLGAIATISGDIPFHFVISGKGTEGSKLHALVRKLHIEDKVSFLGFVPDDDLPLLYAMSDCFIMAGTAELQSIVTMEAMASGLPILAANAVALPHLVRHRENGYLFNPDDMVSIADAIRSVFSDTSLQRSMSRKSLEYIKEHDIEKTIDAFEDLYATVIPRS